MNGAAESPGSKKNISPAGSDWGPAQGDVAALIRALCGQGLKRGVRVVAADKKGHIFFDQGHVVHAEFGEDVGLGAVIEMLHSRPVEFRPCARPWPSQPTLFFTAEKLLAATRPGAANQITGMRLKPGLLPNEELTKASERPERLEPRPSPQPSPAPARIAPPRSAGTAAAGPPLAAAVTELSRAVAAAAEAHRTSTSTSAVAAPRPASRTQRGPFTSPPPPSSEREAASGSRVTRPGGHEAAPGSRVTRSGGHETAPASRPRPSVTEREPPSPARAPAPPPKPEPAPPSRPSHAVAPERQPLTPARTLLLTSSPSNDSVSGLQGPPQPSVSPASVAQQSPSLQSTPAPPGDEAVPASQRAPDSTATVSAPAAGSSPGSSPVAAASPGGRAQRTAPASEPSHAAQRAASAEDSQREPLAPPRPRLPVVWVQRSAGAPGSSALPERAPSSLPLSESGRPATSMVRVSSRGVLLAARGAQSEQLANAASFIHNQVKLIAQDLGRHGRTALHVQGGGLSLLVVKSEVNDIAAALGPSERLRSLLRKAGLG